MLTKSTLVEKPSRGAKINMHDPKLGLREDHHATRAPRQVITLLSDFGMKDPYVAEMKATILSICREAKIVDISHGVEKFNVRMGAFLLASAAPFFPENTIHVAVVDPGVGTERRALLVVTERCYFVGPDNGVLMLAAPKASIQHVYLLENPQYMRPTISTTFHGRDIFAPAAAYLAKGCAAPQFGNEIDNFTIPKFAETHLRKNIISGEVLHVDDFGNIITNIPAQSLENLTIHRNSTIKMKLGQHNAMLQLCAAYGDVSPGEALALVGSHDYLEISINQGNAAQQFQVKSGDLISVWRASHGGI